MLIAIEGIDLTGKSTLTAKLHQALLDDGHDVVLCSSFYDQPKAEHWAQLFFHTEPDVLEEQMLVLYAHLTTARRKIIPALEAGKVVLMDRYLLSALTMQGYIHGLRAGADFYGLITNQGNQRRELPMPTLNVVLTIEEDEWLRRRELKDSEAGIDRIEQRSWSTYHEPLQTLFVAKSGQVTQPRYGEVLISPVSSGCPVSEILARVRRMQASR